MAVHSEISPGQRQSPHRTRHKEPASLRRILAYVDGTERTNRVLGYLTTLSGRDSPIDVVLLNVQPQPENWRLRGYETFKQDEVRDRLVNDLGAPIIAGVGRHLDQLGIPYTSRVELGETAETIVRCAREEKCDVVIMAEPAARGIRGWIAKAAGMLSGSTAGRLIQIAETPVVVLK